MAILSKKKATTGKTLYLPKNQAGIGLMPFQYHCMAMRTQQFLKLEVETNPQTRIILTRYNLALTLYQQHKDF